MYVRHTSSGFHEASGRAGALGRGRLLCRGLVFQCPAHPTLTAFRFPEHASGASTTVDEPAGSQGDHRHAAHLSQSPVEDLLGAVRRL